MSKKLLFQFDTDVTPSVFDTVVAYDGGVDHVTGISNVTPENVLAMVDGCIYTRPPKEKQFTGIFVGGSSLYEGQMVFDSVKNRFFSNFRVSVMFDSNGSNTTAAAAVANIARVCELHGKKVVILGGTGPVGQRAAALFASEGAEVFITSRSIEKAEKVSNQVNTRFSTTCGALPGETHQDRVSSIKDASVVMATGASGVLLLEESDWISNKNIEVLCDANAMPPLGIQGIEMNDKATDRNGKKTFGAIGFGGLKIGVHRECISRLFLNNNTIFDAEEIYKLAKEMV
ncbi:MAG: methylenetetrahydrofolate dehydrogenase [Betaproteobacteria bacterium TMED41]|nr:MAG: methylenetetrahydrofolate dehydrogenase [Betaproteobacteria bacterium TMED41]|tara:strand:+ start:474 stop:1334 length:861 start_codon:yes stop_codon:yes gene_type:complete